MEASKRILLCDIGWRQFRFVASADHEDFAGSLRTTTSAGWVGNSLLCVISQDCDLDAAADKEPLVDLLIGRPIAHTAPEFTQNRNPRVFDAKVSLEGQERAVRFQMHEKAFAPKEWFTGRQPHASADLSAESVKYLRFWLRDRYVRTALPNALIKRIDPTKDKLAKSLKKVEGLRLFIDYSPKDELTDVTIPYRLELHALFDERIADPKTCQEAYIQCIRRFEKCEGIELTEGEVVPENEATIAFVRDLVKFGYEYLSSEGEPPTDGG